MWVCVCVGFVMCVSFDNVCTCIYCVFYCMYCVFCIFWFMYIYIFLFCLYQCTVYYHRVTTELQLVVIVLVVVFDVDVVQ